MFSDFIFDFLVDVYLGLALLTVPERKLKKWQVFMLKTLCIFAYLTCVAVCAVGIWILEETVHRTLGIGLIAGGVIFMVFQIILFIVVFVKRHKRKK